MLWFCLVLFCRATFIYMSIDVDRHFNMLIDKSFLSADVDSMSVSVDSMSIDIFNMSIDIEECRFFWSPNICLLKCPLTFLSNWRVQFGTILCEHWLPHTHNTYAESKDNGAPSSSTMFRAPAYPALVQLFSIHSRTKNVSCSYL